MIVLLKSLPGRILFLGLVCLLGGAVAGCNPAATDSPVTRAPDKKPGDDQFERVRNLPPDPNVLEVKAFWDAYSPFVKSADSSKVQGLMIKVLYLLGPQQKGVFGDGIIRPRLYLMQRDAYGKAMEPRLIREWEFDVERATAHRVVKYAQLGWAYAFIPLEWGKEMDLTGREVRVIISFERSDGRVVSSRPKDIKIPRSM